jgi:glycosyltransferase involved in cell wall biosynthesis
VRPPAAEPGAAGATGLDPDERGAKNERADGFPTTPPLRIRAQVRLNGFVSLLGPARRAAKAALRAREARWHRPPQLVVDERPTANPTIYYLTPDAAGPSGGVKVIYRHVDTLNALGRPAAVLHGKAGFRCTWFDNATRVVAATETKLHPDDILVVPEYYGPGLDRIPAGPAIVIFNQRAYTTFDLVPYDETGPGAPYAGLVGLKAMLAVSEDNVDLLRFAFPDLPVRLARQVIDPSVFHPGAATGRRIAFTTTRRGGEREALLHILRSRGTLAGWELVPIQGRTERQMADILRTSPLFLSFSEKEGFGLPPAEAMACGAYVIGYTGMAGRDFFDSSVSSPVADGDLLAFARAVEEAIARYDKDPETLAAFGREASRRVLSRYSADGLRADLGSFYASL